MHSNALNYVLLIQALIRENEITRAGYTQASGALRVQCLFCNNAQHRCTQSYGKEKKMTKSDFIRNNQGMDDDQDLLEDYLGFLYDHIVKTKIKMKDDTLIP